MNVKLSVYSSRPKKKTGYVIYKNGIAVETKVGSMIGDNIKEDILSSLTRGLRACRGYVIHEDILYIEIQNQHLCSWLSGCVEHKGYSDTLDAAFEALESLDCRYRFVFVEKPSAKSVIEEGKVEVKGLSFENAFGDLV